MVRGLTYTVLAASVLPTTGIVSPLPTKAQLLMRTPELRSSVMMQYGQGYGQGYGAQQYGAQQSYGQQSYGQQSYGATKTLWTLSAFYGVGGNSKFTGAANVAQKYRILPYALGPGDKHVLSRWNMLFPTPVVSRVQCTVEVLPDGTCVLHSNGKNPTGVRSQGGPWGGLQKGQWRMLNNGDQISLDCTNPDAAVFVCQNMPQGPGGMQQGYPQQGYPQQGYPPQGGYPQQGGYR